jgi:DNA-binding MarR family transcriptional regulator
MNETETRSLKIWKAINSIHTYWSKIGENRLSDSGVSIMEFKVLKTLNTYGSLPMIRIADLNMITQGWVTSLVDRLEAKNLVRRVRSSNDRRIVTIESTQDGTSLYNAVKEVHQRYVDETLDILSGEEKDLLLEKLSMVEKKAAEGFNACKASHASAHLTEEQAH